MPKNTVERRIDGTWNNAQATVSGGGSGGSGSGASAAPTVFAVSIGDGVALTYTVTHALGSSDVLVQVNEVGGSRYVAYPAVRIIDANSVLIEFAVAPAFNAFRVVVVH